MANAALAGGVAVGATCNVVSPMVAFGVGLAAGTLCTIGYAVVQPRLDRSLKIVDTCGVHNLHGMPGLPGGLTAALVVPGIAKAQLLRRPRRIPGSAERRGGRGCAGGGRRAVAGLTRTPAFVP